MSDNATQEVELELHEMDDEQALAYIDKALETPVVIEDETPTDDVEEDEIIGEDEEIVNDSEDTPEKESEKDSEEKEDDTEKSEKDSQEEEIKENTTDKSKKEEEESEDKENKEDNKSEEIDLKYKKIFEPFKANGKEMQVDTADEVIELMKMGAGFYKKMSELKPHLRITKMLENNDLLDENKLNYLIDLSNKNPDAIQKLLKDSKTDVLEIDLEKDTSYKPTDHTVSDEVVALDTVLNSIENTDTFKDTMKTITEEWDQASRDIILGEPAIISDINAHKANGIYDKIDQAVIKAKMLNKVPHNLKSDLAIYKYYGDQLHEQGAFNNVTPEASPVKTTEVDKKDKSNSKANALQKRKQAAAPTKSKSTKKQTSSKAVNIQEMTDEEFEKYFNQNIEN